MIALVLERAGLDPTAVIGGRLSASAAMRGSDRVTTWWPRPMKATVLSDAVAVDCRRHQHRRRAHGELRQPGGASRRVRGVREQGPFYGATVACADDANLRASFRESLADS